MPSINAAITSREFKTFLDLKKEIENLKKETLSLNGGAEFYNGIEKKVISEYGYKSRGGIEILRKSRKANDKKLMNMLKRQIELLRRTLKMIKKVR